MCEGCVRRRPIAGRVFQTGSHRCRRNHRSRGRNCKCRASEVGERSVVNAALDRLMKGNARYIERLSRRHDFKNECEAVSKVRPAIFCPTPSVAM
jgi:hypothetical protein